MLSIIIKTSEIKGTLWWLLHQHHHHHNICGWTKETFLLFWECRQMGKGGGICEHGGEEAERQWKYQPRTFVKYQEEGGEGGSFPLDLCLIVCSSQETPSLLRWERKVPFRRVFSRQRERAVFTESELPSYLEIMSKWGGEGRQRAKERHKERGTQKGDQGTLSRQSLWQTPRQESGSTLWCR